MTSSFVSRLGNAPEEGVKAPVKAASTVDITLSGTQTVDGVDLTAGQRCLVAGQTDSTENGIYTVSGGAWSRAADFNKADDVVNGVIILDTNSGNMYQAIFTGTYDPGVTSVTFYITNAGPSNPETLTNKTIVVADNTIVTEPTGSLIANELNAALAELDNGITTGEGANYDNFNTNGGIGFETVADLQGTSLPAGVMVQTKGYSAAGDGGGGLYLIQTAVDYAGTPDEIFDHTLTNLNIAKLQTDKTINILQGGADPTGGTDALSVITAAFAYVGASGTVYAPSGSYKTTGVVLISKSGARFKGDGPKRTYILPNFDTVAVFEIDSATLIERCGVFDCEIAHSVTRTGSSPTIIFGRGHRMYAQDVEITGAAIGLQYGYASNPGETVNGRLVRFRANTSNHGVTCTSQAALFINGSTLNGVPSNASSGINIEGYMDGLWVDDETTIEEHDTGLRIAHSTGNVANIYMNAPAIDRPKVYGVRVEPTGTGGINGLFLNGLKIFDTVGSGNTDGVFIGGSSSGTFERIYIDGVKAHDLRQRFINVAIAVTDLKITGCVSMNGGVKSAASYSAIELNSLAHDRVTITGNHIEGVNDYALNNAFSCTNITTVGNNFANVSTGAMNNVGSVSKSRHFSDNTGERNKRSYLIGPFTYTDLPANTTTTALLLPTRSSGVNGFFESTLAFSAIRAGRVSGITVSSREARTAGSAVFTTHINNSPGTLAATLDATNPQDVTAAQDSGDVFAAGDQLGVKFVTDAGWLPITSEIVVYLEIEEV